MRLAAGPRSRAVSPTAPGCGSSTAPTSTVSRAFAWPRWGYRAPSGAGTLKDEGSTRRAERTLPPTDRAVAVIKDWFTQTFPGHTVECGIVGQREVVLFRAYLPVPRSPRYEIEVSFEAFADQRASTIVHDLDAAGAAQRLRKAPTARLLYDRRRRLREVKEAP